MKRAILLLGALAVLPGPYRTLASGARPGYLELRETTPGRYEVLWQQPGRGEKLFDLAPAFPEECTVVGVGDESLRPGDRFARMAISCEGGLVSRTIAVAGRERPLTDVLVRVRHAGASVETHLLSSGSMSVPIAGRAGLFEAALTYLRLGFRSFLTGPDHLFLLFGLLLLGKGSRARPGIVMRFTFACCAMFAAAAMGGANPSGSSLDAMIALSVLFLGSETLRSWRGGTSLAIRNPRAMAAFSGGLLGLTLARGLAPPGLLAGDLPFALALFALGVAVGQLLCMAVVLLFERSIRILEIPRPRWAADLPAYAVGSLGAYWTIQRLAFMFGRTP